MNDQVKRLIILSQYDGKNLENKLEKLAEQGYFLQKCGTVLWTFRKGEPKKLKYTVTYFQEGSVFNPGLTDNQQTLFEYAEAAGWQAVAQINQMQIFSSQEENPIPFDTDEVKKLENIKLCMKKSFVYPTLAMFLVFFLNLVVLFNSFNQNKIDFLADSSRIVSFIMVATVFLYYAYLLVSYFMWCKASTREVESGGKIIEGRSKVRKIIDYGVVSFILACFFIMLYNLSAAGNWAIMCISIAIVPIVSVVFFGSVKYLKKKWVAGTTNKVVSTSLLILATIAYMSLLATLIIRFDFSGESQKNYRTVTAKVSDTQTYNYRIYRDKIPLMCEDLYKKTGYGDYSYQKIEKSTVFLTKTNYYQSALLGENAPENLEYQVIKPHLQFVWSIAHRELLTLEKWQNDSIWNPIDNQIFGTVEAYNSYYQGQATGNYILFFEDRIVSIKMEEKATPAQIETINTKLIQQN